MKKLLPIVTMLACLATGYAFANGTELPSDTRIKLLNYSDTDVYTITTKYGYQTNIVFGEGEEIQTVSVGDRSLWQIIPSANRLFIRPMDENVITNMTVLTNKHSYQFDLKSIGDKKDGNIYVAKFTYPEDKPIPPISAIPPVFPPPVPAPVATQDSLVHIPAQPPTEEPGVTQPLHPNYNYTYSGPDNLAPLQVYDDGKATFIKYQNIGKPFPDVSIMGADGSEKSAPYSIEDGLIMVDAVAPEIVLRNNEGSVHIYNEMLNPK